MWTNIMCGATTTSNNQTVDTPERTAPVSKPRNKWHFVQTDFAAVHTFIITYAAASLFMASPH